MGLSARGFFPACRGGFLHRLPPVGPITPRGGIVRTTGLDHAAGLNDRPGGPSMFSHFNGGRRRTTQNRTKTTPTLERLEAREVLTGSAGDQFAVLRAIV